MVRLSELTTEDAAAAWRAARLAIVPVGATEQHGPHLSVATDLRIAEELARRLADALGPAAVLCPSLPYGLSEHHERFPGTVTLTPATFVALTFDVVASLAAAGFERIVFMNGHGGNLDALRLVVRRARSELGVRAAAMMWIQLAREACAAEAAGPVWGHACEVETSIAMAIAPDVVRADRIRPPVVRTDVEPLSAPWTARVDVAHRYDELAADGVLGDPTRATTAAGERIVATVLDRAVAFARAFVV